MHTLTHPAKAQRSKTADWEEQAPTADDLYQVLEAEARQDDKD